MDNIKQQPKSKVVITKKEFDRIKQTVSNMVEGKKVQADQLNNSRLPIDLGIFLTGKCNLRCKHCFEWNEDGFLSAMDLVCANREIPLEYIKQCLDYTKPKKTRLYLWGGEPLLYSKFPQLCELLKEDPRWITLCTNGLLVEKKMEYLKPISENLVLLTSLDGFQESHELIRGAGTYQKTIDSIKLVTSMIKSDEFKGKQSVNCVISESMVGKLYEFCEYMESLEIDTLYICLPWYISEETANKMDQFFDIKFASILERDKNKKASWHDFKYHLDEKCVNDLVEDLKKISNHQWNIRVRFQPAVQLNEVSEFTSGICSCVQNKKQCLAVVNRMDILQDGTMSACKLFKEFTIGNLKDHTVEELWNSMKFQQIRKVLSKELMPVCSKCVLLYLNGI